MAKRRVITHFMHEYEEAEARQAMPGAEATESYLVGEVEENEIPELRRKGLIVQPVDDQAEEEAPSATLGGPAPEVAAPVPRAFGAEPALDASGPNFYYVRLRGPLLDKWRAELQRHGVQLLEKSRRFTYTARLTPEQARTVLGLPFVSGVRIYGPEDSGRPRSRRAAVASSSPRDEALRLGAPAPPAAARPPAAESRMLTFDVRLHRAEDLGKVRGWLQGLGLKLAGASGRKIRLYLMDDGTLDAELQAIRAVPEVAHVEEYVAPKLHNDAARQLLGIDPGGNPGVPLPQTGAGQIVAVADTGLDDTHKDFQGRIVGLIARGRPNVTTDPHGHGTHVAGSVLSDGSASQGRFRGAAPGASLFFQSLLDADGGLSGLPLDLGDLFDEAYQAGARIHNNSWGAVVGSEYTLNSLEVDEFVASHRDMLIVISAGNEGQAANRVNSQPGFVDWLSIGSPASCKNALTVGAGRSSRTSGGYSQLTYGQAWPAEFPLAPIGTENVSGNPECMAGFSSRGPCTDRRIKPDVVAPGTDIVSAKSKLAPLRRFWGSVPGHPEYGFMGGTSMAAPLVAGCAALVREYYVTTRNHQPSAALLKATLINGAHWLTGGDAVAEHPDAPNYHQGFGAVSMLTTIPNASARALRLEFLDPWQDPQQHFVRNGQRVRRQVTVSGGAFLRICLVWTDGAARALQNNLNLFVQHLPTQRKWIGNDKLPRSLGIPDPENNVEVVRLDNPAPGDYLIQITASNLLQAGQDYALVVVGELGSGLVTVV
jgi:subtilisin family serine protease